MQSTPVSGGPVPSRVMLVGQAPGVKEPVLGRPFAWTAGKAMFKWFEQETGVTEMEFRQTVYMAAVCRCFPGKNSQGGDRVPSREEVALCGAWLRAEIAILKPGLVIPVGKLAIGQFLDQLPVLTDIDRSHDARAQIWPRLRCHSLAASIRSVALAPDRARKSTDNKSPGFNQKSSGLDRADVGGVGETYRRVGVSAGRRKRETCRRAGVWFGRWNIRSPAYSPKRRRTLMLLLRRYAGAPTRRYVSPGPLQSAASKAARM